ncbi:MAG TPA: DUF4132 domain-containing protein [Candidatus Lokiarchaeia archaeon]|nr:DUF4132 domain-containing protein [Candidatus Lokiarchaeia archaeon]
MSPVKANSSPFPIAGEAWSDQALADFEEMPEKDHEIWTRLFQHGQSLSGSKPSGKWLKLASSILDELGREKFMAIILWWFPLVNKPRTRPLHEPKLPNNVSQFIIDMVQKTNEDQILAIHPQNMEVLKRLVCFASIIDNHELARALTALALSTYRKIPNIGARAPKVGNACLYALGELPGMTGVDQLAILKTKVRTKSAIKGVEKALHATAERLGISADELEEIGIPSYGMTEVGVLRETMGDFIADARVTSTHSMEVHWEKSGGKPQNSVPASVKEQHGEDLKEFQAAMKDIQKMLPSQRDRLDRLFISRHSWAYTTWRDRYLDHPLMGYLARRIIWTFTTGTAIKAGIYLEGHVVDVYDQLIEGLGDQTTVALWHPIDHSVDDVLAWREWLERHEVQQPFKQAHREVYILTDAERETAIYSNRYAAHVIKQHQFHSLAGVRRWNSTLRLIYDGLYPPTSLSLPEWGLRVEFWTEGAGDDFGTDTNDTGTYLYLITDQVFFLPLDDAQHDAIPLQDIPPLVFSEAMRDVDLFIGVASVGNDPNWFDGGPEGRYRTYWTGYSFGELSTTAKTRKEVLEQIVPRLKIKDRCSFSDKFLSVKGDLRAYKIHIGSGNILMEPNDQYLCIVPQQGGHGAERRDTPLKRNLFLPFEGDNLLSIIISKALLLAEDSKITDTTILSQILRKS